MATTVTGNRKDTLIAQRDRTAQRAKLMLDTLERESRAFTPEEQRVYDSLEAQTESLSQRIEREDSDAGMMDAIDRITGGQAMRPTDPSAARIDHRSPGEQFASDPQFREFIKAGGHRRAGGWHSPVVELHATTLTEGAGSGAALVVPDRQSGIVETVTRVIVVADLIAPGTTDSNVVQYMKETAFTNAADAVLEGGLKPESALAYAAVNEPVKKLAHWIPATEEILEDVSQMRSIIDARLRHGLELKEDDELLNGSGVDPHLTGFLHRAGLAPSIARVDPVTNADAIHEQIFAIWTTTLLRPSGIIMHPSNWKTIVQLKDTTGQYYGGGPFAPQQAPTLWGLPVALTPAIVVGTCLVGAFRPASQLFRRGGIRLEASNSHADYFIRNMVAIRAEERLALAVYREAAFGTVTALN